MTDRFADVDFRPTRTEMIYRHAWPVRVMHWINVVAMFILLLSGLQIFNAHPALYWGQASDFEHPLLSMDAQQERGGPLRGVTTVAGHAFDTTGVLGASSSGGVMQARGFPAWATIPGPGWLAMGRRWHFFFAWVFVLNGLAYVTYAFVGRHFARDLKPTRADWRGIGGSIVDHVKFRHPQGEAAKRYNVLQKLAYILVAFVLGPVMVLMGLAMSPRMNTWLGWLTALAGGRQSARTIHFIIAALFVAFVLVHLFEVLVSGVANQLRSMITGRFEVTVPAEKRDD